MSDNTAVESKESSGLGQIVAVIGAFSAVVVFIAADSSFSFARGLMTSLGFPAQIMTLRTSLDFFPTMGTQYAFGFVVMFGLGFLIFKPGEASDKTVGRRIAGVAVLSVSLVLIVDFWPNNRWRVLNACLTFGSQAAPLLVGYAYRSLRNEFPQRKFAIVVSLICVFLLHDAALFDFGYKKGNDIATRAVPEFPSTERGFAVIKMKDFPIIDLQSKERLNLSTIGTKEDDHYSYSSSANCFLRLVAYDDSNYYFIENNSGRIRPLAIRKEMVQQMIFQGGL
jgi:hypothetical protein